MPSEDTHLPTSSPRLAGQPAVALIEDLVSSGAHGDLIQLPGDLYFQYLKLNRKGPGLDLDNFLSARADRENFDFFGENFFPFCWSPF